MCVCVCVCGCVCVYNSFCSFYYVKSKPSAKRFLHTVQPSAASFNLHLLNFIQWMFTSSSSSSHHFYLFFLSIYIIYLCSTVYYFIFNENNICLCHIWLWHIFSVTGTEVSEAHTPYFSPRKIYFYIKVPKNSPSILTLWGQIFW